MKRKIHINFLFAEDYLGCYPSLINALTIIDNNKIKTNFLGYSFESSFPKYPRFKNVNYLLTKRNEKISRSYEINHKSPNFIISVVEKISSRFKFNLYFILKHNLLNLKNNYYKIKEIIWNIYLLFKNESVIRNNYVICIDSNTLISSFLFKIIFRKRFKTIFWSLEISSYSEIDLLERMLEQIEFYALKNVISVISQSKERLSLIKNFRKISTEKIDCFFIPHSRIKTNNIERNNYFNLAFNLRKESIVLLHLGWIHDVMDSYNLAKSTLSWVSDFKLVFHERAKREKDDPYIKSICDLNSDSLHLSLSPVPYEDLGDLITSCDIGLVVYQPEQYGAAWSNIAKASGKLADYLAFGKPIICSNLPDLKELVEKYKCGLVFNEFSEIPSLIAEINKKYKMYSGNALQCFSKEFEFSKFFKPFINKIIHKSNNYSLS